MEIVLAMTAALLVLGIFFVGWDAMGLTLVILTAAVFLGGMLASQRAKLQQLQKTAERLEEKLDLLLAEQAPEADRADG